jgi:hypothetical protein
MKFQALHLSDKEKNIYGSVFKIQSELQENIDIHSPTHHCINYRIITELLLKILWQANDYKSQTNKSIITQIETIL